MSQQYSEHYIQVCNMTETQAIEILGRPLTERERSAIWEAGTLTWLEMRVQVPMHQNPQALASTLAAAAYDLDGRLADMIDGLAGLLYALLERDLTITEQTQLARIPNVLAVMQIGEDLTAADPAQRESLLHQMLDTL